MNMLEERDWDSLLRRIRENCTHFLEAEAYAGSISLSSEVARKWAEEYDYPPADWWDLARVAQFMAVKRDPMFPKSAFDIEQMFDRFAL